MVLFGYVCYNYFNFICRLEFYTYHILGETAKPFLYPEDI